MDTILTTTYLYVNIFNLQSGQKYAFFLTTDHPFLVHVVIERPPVSLFVNVNEVNEKVEDVSKAIEWRISTMTENGERFKSGENGDVSK